MALIKRKLAAALVLASALGSNAASAVGLGEIKLNSALNQKFDAEIKLLNVGDLSRNEILPNLASHAEFSRAGVERVFFLTGLKFEVSLGKNGEATIHVTSDQIVREPFLNFLVELHWPSGRILREYTVLLDPPIFSEAPAPAVRQAASSTERQQGGSASDTKKKPEKSSRDAISSSSGAARSATTSGGAEARESVRVQKNDTLWGIAKANRPSSEVTIRQTMLAIQRHNPQAFIRNNINLLKAGHVLKIPNVGQIQELASEEVRAEIARQNEAWRSNQTIDATQDDPILEEPTSRTSETPAPTVGQLQLLSDDAQEAADEVGESASGTSAEEASENLSAFSGDTDEALAEVQDQSQGAAAGAAVEDLQSQIDNLKKLLALKDQQLAILQADNNDPATDSALAQGEQPTSLALPANNNANAMAAAAQGNAEPSQPVAQEKGLLDMLKDNLLYIGLIFGVSLVVLLVLAAISRRKNEDAVYGADLQSRVGSESGDVQLPDDLDSELDDDQLVATPAKAAVAAQPQEDSADQQQAAKISKLLEEADIYIAYGRYERALEMLQPAVNKNPKNVALRLKLVEIFIATGDMAKLSQQEADLQAIGDAQALAKLEDLKGDAASSFESEEPAESEAVEVADNLVEFTPRAAAQTEPEEEDFAGLDDAPDAETKFDAGIEFTLDEAEPDTEDELSADYTADDQEDDFLGDTDEVATKLELGRAYLDMEDKEAAIDILNEVVEGGNDAQKEEARKLLKSIA